MVVNSDDGFEVSAGKLDDRKLVILGEFDGGRGSADTEFLFKVDQAGVYLFRLLWFEGDGGANVEWFTVGANGARALVNGTQAGSLKSYRTRTNEPTNALPDEFTSIKIDGNTLTIEWTGSGKLEETEDFTQWSPVNGATSPYSTSVDGTTMRYYRLSN